MDDFAVACTGVVGSEPPAKGIFAGDEGSIDFGSSVSGISQANLEAILESRFQKHDSKIDNKLDAFAVAFVNMIEGEMKAILDDRLPNKPSVSAPQVVSFQPGHAAQPEDPLRNPQSCNECTGGGMLRGGCNLVYQTLPFIMF